MYKFLLTLLSTFTLLGCAHAQDVSGNQVALFVDRNFPAFQTVSIGAKTPAGFGETSLQYTGFGTLTIVGGCTTQWCINSRNRLVPTGTYAAAPPALSGPYTLTVTDGTYSSVVTINTLPNTETISGVPTGTNADTSTVSQANTILSTAGRAAPGDTVIARTSSFNPTGADWRVTPPVATGANWDAINPVAISAISLANPAVFTSTAHGFTTGQNVQLENIAGLRGPYEDQFLNTLTYVVQVIDVDHYSLVDLQGTPLNTTGWNAYTGSGTAHLQLVIQSETPLGFTVGRLSINSFNAGDVCFPVTYNQVNFYLNDPTNVPTSGAQIYLHRETNALGGCVSFANSSFSVGPAVLAAAAFPGMPLVQGVGSAKRVTIYNSTFHDLFQGVSTTLGNNESSGDVVSWNIFHDVWYDMIDGNWSLVNFSHNLVYNKKSPGGAHQDFIQQTHLVNGENLPGGVICYNTVARNIGTPGGPDIQMVFGSGGTGFLTGLEICNNIGLTTFGNAISLSYLNAPIIKFNTALNDFSPQIGLSVGSIAGTTLTVTSITSGIISAGSNSVISGTGILAGTTVTAGLTGVNGVGTYTVSRSQTVPLNTTISSVQTAQSLIALATGASVAGTDATINRNISNIFGTTVQAGVVTITPNPNITISNSSAAYLPAFPYYHNCCDLTTRDAQISNVVPDPLGVACNADGTCNGAVLPRNDYGEQCWNIGDVWDHTAHCILAK